MADYLFDYRNTLAGPASFAGDPVGAIPIYPTVAQYTAGQTYGYVSTQPAGNDLSGTIDVRLAGTNSNTSRSTRFRIDMNNGNYKLRLASGQNGVSVRHQVAVWDGGMRDAGATVNIATWTASAAIAAGSYVVLPDSNGVFCLLKTTAGGTNAATFTPGTGAGPFTDSNGVVWTLIKRAIVSADSVLSSGSNNPSGSVMDATGVSQTFANWPTLHALSPSFAVTQGFVEVTRGNDGVNYPRHYAFLAQSTPLQDLTYTDAFGNTSAAPTLYAGQPGGTVMLRPLAATGGAAPSNFTLGGTLAPYLDVATVNNQTWIVSKVGNAIPDSMAGSQTLIITQTDASGSITGSPHVNPTLTLTVISSQGKKTDKSLEGMMRTEMYLELIKFDALKATEWAQTLPTNFVSNQTATSPSDFATKLANIGTPNGTGWYRIGLSGAGNWATFADIAITSMNFGSGGLLIESESGFTDQLNCKFKLLYACGIWFHNLALVPLLGGNNAQGSYRNIITLRDEGTANGYYNKVKISDCLIGLAHKPGYDPGTDQANHNNGIVSFHANQLICDNNKVWGVDDADQIFATRYARINNDIRICTGDAGCQGAFSYQDTIMNVFADNDCWLIRESTHQTAYDAWNVASGSHPDFAQSRAPDHSWWDAATITLGAQYVTADGRLYLATSGGTKGATEPSWTGAIGTSGSDGTQTFTFQGYMTGAKATLGRQHVLLSGGHLVCQGTTTNVSNSGAEAQLFLDSGRGCYPTDVTVFNFIESSANGYGISNAQYGQATFTPGKTYVDCCTLVGPPTVPTNQLVAEKFIDVGAGQGIIRNTILGIAGGVPFVEATTSTGPAGQYISENNVAVQWTNGAVAPNRPQDQLIGTFSTDAAGRQIYTLTDTTAITPAQMRTTLESILLTPTRLVGARTKLAAYTPTITETLAGAVSSPKANTMATLNLKARS